MYPHMQYFSYYEYISKIVKCILSGKVRKKEKNIMLMENINYDMKPFIVIKYKYVKVHEEEV